MDASRHAAQISESLRAEFAPTKDEEQKYLFVQESKADSYIAQAFVLRCFDERFRQTTKTFLKFMGLLRYDPASVAGGGEVFSSPELEQDFDYMMRELEKSISLHETKRCLVFTHHDCGAYGRFSQFNNNAEEEFKFHQAEHRKIRENILARFPILKSKPSLLTSQA